jgi:hypothetical protein
VGQFRPCPIRTALWRARLPEVVAPIWFEEPARHPGWDDWASGDDAAAGSTVEPGVGGDGIDDTEHDIDDGDGPDGREDVGRVIRRGHLTLVSGLAG